MLKSILAPVLMAAAAAGGVYASETLKARDVSSAALPSSEGHAKPTKSKDAKADKSNSHAKPSSKAGSGEISYFKFKRQFVVPVLGQEGVEALVLMNIALVLADGDRDDTFQHEPKFRDAFIRELLELSDAGYLNENMASPGNYEVIREALLKAARDIDPEAVEDVLILDLTRQDR